jgi:hypothetical protein
MSQENMAHQVSFGLPPRLQRGSNPRLGSLPENNSSGRISESVFSTPLLYLEPETSSCGETRLIPSGSNN